MATVSRNEMLHALNQADKFVLAVILVETNTVGAHFLLKAY
jgi:hypothetical protein